MELIVIDWLGMITVWLMVVEWSDNINDNDMQVCEYMIRMMMIQW